MSKNKQGLSYTDRIKRGLATTMVLASLVGSVSPIMQQVSAAELNYESGLDNEYVTEDTADYTIKINPMLGSKDGNAITPQGGTYQVKQIERFKITGENIEFEGNTQTVTLDSGENRINVTGDGVYEITPTTRVPGYYRDIGATEKLDNKGEIKETNKDGFGKYVYAFPLMSDGVASEGQEVDFMPKLRDVREDLVIDKIGDDQKTALEGVEFTVYQRFDERTQESFGDGENSRGTVTTNSKGQAEFKNLPEGKYYFVEGKNVSDKYLPDSRKVEFNVEVDSKGDESYIRALDNNDSVSTEGKNKRGEHKDKAGTITRFNYKDPAEAKDRTYYELKTDYTRHGDDEVTTKSTGEKQGIMYVNTNGEVDFASHVDIPKNINDYENFKVVDTVDNKAIVDEASIELRTIGRNGVEETYSYSDLDDLTLEDNNITLDGKGSSKIKDILESKDVDQYVLTYKAQIDTENIKEGVEYDVLNFTQTLTSDDTMTDGTNSSKVTTHPIDVHVQEGQIVVDKEEDVGEDSEKLEGAEFQLYERDDKGDFTHDKKQWKKASNPRTGEDYFGTTDENGELVFSNLPYGTYLLVETKAPEGYRVNKNHKVIEVDKENQENVDGVNTKTHTIKNMRRTQIFPGTGTMGNIVTLMVIATAGGTFIYVTAKKKEEEEGQSDAQ